MIIVNKSYFNWEDARDFGDFIINPVNCVGVSGAGFALETKKRFPEDQVKYELECKMKRLMKSYYFISGEVVYLPTKNHWKDKITNFKLSYKDILENSNTQLVDDKSEGFSNYSIYCSLKRLENHFKELSPKIFYMPLLGCGLAGGRSEKFLEMMNAEFSESKNHYVIYDADFAR